MKKFLKILFLITVLLVFSACKEQKVKEPPKELEGIAAAIDGVRYSEMQAFYSVAPEGTFHALLGDFLIHFISEETGEDMIFCYDPACTHERASDTNPDPTCRAALFPTTTRLFYYEGILYYLVWDSISAHNLYKMEVSGSGRKFIAKIPYREAAYSGQAFYGDKMYYVAQKKTLPENAVTPETKTYIIEVDLRTGDYREVTPEIFGPIFGLQVTDGYIWLRQADEGNIYSVRYNMNTFEREVISGPQEYGTFKPFRAYNGYLIYSNGYDQLWLRNMETGEDTLLVDTEGKYIFSYVSGDGIFYDVCEDVKTLKSSGSYFYDLLTGETTDITKMVEKYDIVNYDGYNRVFVCRDRRVIKKERVLGTK